MVRKAEVQRKRSPFFAVFGLLLAVGLFAVAYFITAQVVLKMPQVRSVVGGVMLQAQIGFSVGIWLVLLALAFFLVAMLAGKDPNDSKHLPLPPKQKDLKKAKRK